MTFMFTYVMSFSSFFFITADKNAANEEDNRMNEYGLYIKGFVFLFGRVLSN